MAKGIRIPGIMLASGIAESIGNMGSSVIQGEYNKEEARKNREWQERMSNTAIQRMVKDAEKAGISPAMILGGGGRMSATTPSGSNASISKPNFGNTASELINYINNDRRLDLEERKIDLMEQNMSNTAQVTNQHKELMEERQKIYQQRQKEWSEEYRKEQWKKLGVTQ